MIPLPSPLKEPIKVVAEILQSEMSIVDGRIMLGLENWGIPAEQGLYVALLYGPDSVVGNNSYSVGEGDLFKEVQEVAVNHEVSLDLMSFNSEARLRREETLMSLASAFCKEHSERYGMRVYDVPTAFAAVPSIEETKMLNRFRITFAVSALHRRIKGVPYYDTFTQPEVTHNA